MMDESSPMSPMEAGKGFRIPRFRLNLSTAILVGMVLGIAPGVFFGEMVEFPPPPNFLELYIPANPFHSMAENLIPAVVIFALAIGVALIGIDGKGRFLDDLNVLGQALMKVSGMVVKLTPIGVFAISASAAGTMSVDELGVIQE